MKKKLVTVLLTTALVVSTFTGCASREMPNVIIDDVTTEATNENSNDEIKGHAKAAPMQVIGEEAKETSAEAADTALEVSDEGKQEISNIADAQDMDWSTAYEDYFERENIIGENVKATITASAEGVEFTTSVATTEDTSYLCINFGTAFLEMYATSDKIYAYSEMAGAGTWSYAPVTSKEEADSIVNSPGTTMLNTEEVSSCTYGGEVEINGVIYDTLDTVVETDDGPVESTFYVNRETQKIEKYDFEQDGAVAECFLEEIDTIEIPAEAENGTEVTQEEIAMSIFGIMMVGIASYMETEQ